VLQEIAGPVGAVVDAAVEALGLAAAVPGAVEDRLTVRVPIASPALVPPGRVQARRARNGDARQVGSIASVSIASPAAAKASAASATPTRIA
jgi:hypothetical protein